MRPVRGTAARARVACRLSNGGVDTDDARAMLAREKRCGDAKLVRLLTRWRDAERKADAAFVVDSLSPRSQRAEVRADDAWDALARYVGVVL